MDDYGALHQVPRLENGGLALVPRVSLLAYVVEGEVELVHVQPHVPLLLDSELPDAVHVLTVAAVHVRLVFGVDYIALRGCGDDSRAADRAVDELVRAFKYGRGGLEVVLHGVAVVDVHLQRERRAVGHNARRDAIPRHPHLADADVGAVTEGIDNLQFVNLIVQTVHTSVVIVLEVCGVDGEEDATVLVSRRLEVVAAHDIFFSLVQEGVERRAKLSLGPHKGLE
ncbi:hypothetical protein E2C01_000785 [Portunus trituberculatus]|uniref:Uncharacterized protein n=1 Tax=Portunus trituberculatus TaxID=210409 RepID=A0A5B7CF89_PORTR|nr:hypothetical protein [Portunus trituberculatus]